MDTLTHGVLGAVAARFCTKSDDKKSLVLVTALAAAFPDLDYLLFWLNPYQFITEWHRGITHSLIMLPIWAALLSAVFYRLLGKRIAYKVLFAYSSLGLLLHLAADLITVYGVQFFTPLSNQRFALAIVFDMDPWIGLLALFSLIFGLIHRHYAVFGVLAIGFYLAILLYFQQSALDTIESRLKSTGSLPTDKIHAIPQPVLPFHWILLIDRQDYYEIAHLSLNGTASQFIEKVMQRIKIKIPGMFPRLPEAARARINKSAANKHPFNIFAINAYHMENQLIWHRHPKFGASKQETELILKVWQQNAFSAFRQFASVPVLYRVDQEQHSTCVWFTDIRYVIPFMQPPFRYGMCRQQQAENWQLFRLKRHSENERQLIKFPDFITLFWSGNDS